MAVIRTLILSGGGGRGAFHAGVYRYLSQIHKPGVDPIHQGTWKPDIIVGTSIGAVNGAAIVQGIDADELLAFWRSLREQDIQGIPPAMSRLAGFFVNQVLKNLIGVSLPRVQAADATSLPPQPGWVPLPGMGKFSTAVLGRWANLLDTGPLRKTITQRLGLDEARIAGSKGTLLINATNVSTGRRVTFSNRPIYERSSSAPRQDVLTGITIQRILASCSIPLVYPWTYDPLSQNMYWDGAVVTNTPLGGALDAASQYPLEDEMEAVVVLMTPWREDNLFSPAEKPELPQNFAEAVTWALDWALLASFREKLDLVNAYNRLADIGHESGHPVLAAIRKVKIIITAPDKFISAARILDYDAYTQSLIQQGYRAAERAFLQHFAQAVSGS
ncbi:MAG: patatin-like phospholipase family protein [Anaerolineaceae bacterium]|nr:patatin-like phospholipase family protein [Anaerolineaceae bacterium]